MTRIIGWGSHKVWFGLQDTKYKSRIPKYKSRTSNTSPGHKIQVLDLEFWYPGLVFGVLETKPYFMRPLTYNSSHRLAAGAFFFLKKQPFIRFDGFSGVLCIFVTFCVFLTDLEL